MKTYRPGQVPDNPAQLPGFLRQETGSLQRAANAAEPYTEHQTLHAAPSKVREGMVAKADGYDWNPGYGAGFYQYTDGSWVPLSQVGNPRYVTDTELDRLTTIANAQLRELKRIALILSKVSGVVIGDSAISAETYQLRELVRIGLILSSMSGVTVSDRAIDLTNF